MGKYNKKTVAQKAKPSLAGRVTLKQKGKANRKGKKGKKAANNQSKKAAVVSGSAAKAAADGDMEMDMDAVSAPAGADRSAADKMVSFLSRARTEANVTTCLQKALQNGPDEVALGAALAHCAGRGLTTCVKTLIENGAPVNDHDPSQAPGRTTPLQLAASRGHVNVCRLLVEAGADRTGAAEAAQDLSKLGAVFAEERKAIQTLLR
mmetsp:Transcript_14711/g.44129  ORF Transcript_14711/g.44129 Transcript_14711/m.44129 type:complete len:207 (+) Transcript_14711:152-772(+)